MRLVQRDGCTRLPPVEPGAQVHALLVDGEVGHGAVAHAAQIDRHSAGRRGASDLGVDGDEALFVDDHRVEVHLGDLGQVLRESRDAQQQLFERVDVEWRGAAVAEEQRRRAQRPHELGRVLGGERQDAERAVREQLGGHASRAEQQQRSEQRVLCDADDHLEPGRRHALHRARLPCRRRTGRAARRRPAGRHRHRRGRARRRRRSSCARSPGRRPSARRGSPTRARPRPRRRPTRPTVPRSSGCRTRAAACRGRRRRATRRRRHPRAARRRGRRAPSASRSSNSAVSPTGRDRHAASWAARPRARAAASGNANIGMPPSSSPTSWSPRKHAAIGLPGPARSAADATARATALASVTTGGAYTTSTASTVSSRSAPSTARSNHSGGAAPPRSSGFGSGSPDPVVAREQLEPGARARVGREDPGPAGVADDRDPAPGGNRLRREQLRGVEQLLQRVDADDARLREQRVDRDVGRRERGSVRRRGAAAGRCTSRTSRRRSASGVRPGGRCARTCRGSRTTRGTGG